MKRKKNLYQNLYNMDNILYTLSFTITDGEFPLCFPFYLTYKFQTNIMLS